MGKKPLFLCGMIIVLCLNFCGCKNEERQYGHAPVIEGLMWGMTKDEIVDIKNLTDQNSSIVKSEQSKAYMIIRFKDTQVIFDQECYINLLVTTRDSWEAWNCPLDSLSAIVLQYENTSYDLVKEAMEKELGRPSKQERSDNTEVFIWNSKDTIKDISDKEKEQLEKYCEKNLVEGKSIYPQDENTAINKITLGVGKNNKVVVTYYGDWSVYINYLHKK